MMNTKGFWYFLMAGTIGLWAAAFATGFYYGPSAGIKAWFFLAGLAAAHCCEAPLALKMFKEREIAKSTIVARTLIFGFTWWLPVKKGILPR